MLPELSEYEDRQIENTIDEWKYTMLLMLQEGDGTKHEIRHRAQYADVYDLFNENDFEEMLSIIADAALTHGMNKHGNASALMIAGERLVKLVNHKINDFAEKMGEDIDPLELVEG